MLNSETKRHIDAARDVLVGVAPNPMTQIDQITFALIYKFMDDMDQASINAGGEPSFFVGELEPYAWSRLMDSRMGNQEKMNLYGEALQKFSVAKQLPELFRTIFRAAFLPYRSPETLGLFLKEISHFDYSHPEELGNAYEYLLSIMSAQGDAGQFRTPRHIIDFMVDVMNPTKDDKVLDPACGTGGFLVATYNHILEQHDGKDDLNQIEKPLTPDERKKLMSNLEGYEIDPSMVRIAQVNMYLHQFKNPRIFQYDSLTSEDRWNDRFDVILANPPFMSPKGGIKPHNKFALQSNRSEVLFVDYIATHLKPNGRAAIIVPEGIIFQSGKAHSRLRKELLKDGLYAVISLPSGVFQPYSGVKTSILLIDKRKSANPDRVLFLELKHLGISLGAARKTIPDNDLPQAIEILQKFRTEDIGDQNRFAFSIAKADIEAQGYSLSASDYRQTIGSSTSYQHVRLGKVCAITKGKSSSTKTEAGPYPLFLTAEATKSAASFDFSGTGVAVPLISATGHGKADVKRVHFVEGKFALANLLAFVEPKDTSALNPKYLFHVLNGNKSELASLMKGAANVSMNVSDLENFSIPLPPLEIQEKIVAELERYTAVVDGAKKIVKNWRPQVDLDSDWEYSTLGEVAEVISGQSPDGRFYNNLGEGTPFYQGKTEFSRKYLGAPTKWTSSVTKTAKANDVLMSVRAPVGPVNLAVEEICIGRGLAAIRAIKINHEFLFYWLKTIETSIQGSGGAVFDSINGNQIRALRVPKLSTESQNEIVSRLREEEAAVSAADQLAIEFENRIARAIDSMKAA
jgi:type I restriction enzyme M protein